MKSLARSTIGAVPFRCLFVCAYLAIAVIVPASGLLSGRSSFSWAMWVVFSRPSFTVVMRDGSEQPLERIEEAQGRRISFQVRPEVDMVRLAPPQICAALPEAAAVRTQISVGRGGELQRLERQPEEYSCP
jgi:hypothetical protein